MEAHPVDPLHVARVTEFQEALRSQTIEDVIWKHITTGSPVMVAQDVYYDLRQRLSREFNLHPSSVVVVGSCRLGFSLKLKGSGSAKSRYQAANLKSDVDVAIVSQPLFDTMWDAIFDLVRRNKDWALGKGRLVSRDLFNGWITPGTCPPYPVITPIQRWVECFDKLNRARLLPFRKVEGRLYRTWNRLEAYQEIHVDECRSELLLGG